MNKLKVLFICKDNSIRSLIACGFLNAYFADRYDAYCAGIEPIAINPCTVKALKEIGIDAPLQRARNIKELSGVEFDCIITLCDYARSFSRSFPKCRKQIHKGFKDLTAFKGSEEEALKTFRCLREEIFAWVENEAVF